MGYALHMAGTAVISSSSSSLSSSSVGFLRRNGSGKKKHVHWKGLHCAHYSTERKLDCRLPVVIKTERMMLSIRGRAISVSRGGSVSMNTQPRHALEFRGKGSLARCAAFRPRKSNGGGRPIKRGNKMFKRKTGSGRNGPDENVPLMNDAITSPQVRIVEEDGTFAGIMTAQQGIAMAVEAGLDLVMIQDQEIPVCKIISYSKYRYQNQKKEKEAQKKLKSNRQDTKELKMRVGIADHDYQVRIRAAKKFLNGGDRVK